MPTMGIPFSKNNCYTYIGDQIVYDETFAYNKERDTHTKKLEELH
jgi:hypothetical protein